ncbi:DNA polymerase III subunit beta [Candidatus Karelsulcia muelleri]
MNFLIKRKDLFQSLQSISSVFSKTNRSRLNCFILKVENKNVLKIKASYLDLYIKTTLKVFTKQKGQAAVPAKLLMDILKHIPEQQLKINQINFNKIRITSGKGNYDISILNYELFPKDKNIKKKPVCVLNKRTFLKIIDNTLFAVGKDDLRPVMNGVCFEINKKKCMFVATNNKILAKYSLDKINTKTNIKFIIPKNTFLVLKKSFNQKTNDIKIKYNKNKIYFFFNKKVVGTSLIKGDFPIYEKLIPKYNKKNKLIINLKELKASIKRIHLFSNKTDNRINFSLSKQKAIIYAENKESTNKAYEELLCEYFGANLDISFNYKDLIEVLTNFKCEEIEIKLQQISSPVLIKPIDSVETETIFRLIVPLT